MSGDQLNQADHARPHWRVWFEDGTGDLYADPCQCQIGIDHDEDGDPLLSSKSRGKELKDGRGRVAASRPRIEGERQDIGARLATARMQPPSMRVPVDQYVRDVSALMRELDEVESVHTVALRSLQKYVRESVIASIDPDRAEEKIARVNQLAEEWRGNGRTTEAAALLDVLDVLDVLEDEPRTEADG